MHALHARPRLLHRRIGQAHALPRFPRTRSALGAGLRHSLRLRRHLLLQLLHALPRLLHPALHAFHALHVRRRALRGARRDGRAVQGVNARTQRIRCRLLLAAPPPRTRTGGHGTAVAAVARARSIPEVVQALGSRLGAGLCAGDGALRRDPRLLCHGAVRRHLPQYSLLLAPQAVLLTLQPLHLSSARGSAHRQRAGAQRGDARGTLAASASFTLSSSAFSRA